MLSLQFLYSTGLFMRTTLLLILSFHILNAWAGPKPKQGYYFTVDLSNSPNHTLTVNLVTPALKGSGPAIYRLPKIIPGTYAIADFGKYVSSFQALNKQGKPLQVKQLDINSWEITPAHQVTSVSYRVHDSFSAPADSTYTFEPAGSDFEQDTVYVLNANCLFGYFDELKRLPYQLNITHPAGFYGATSLVSQSTGSQDVFTTDSYMALVDAPIMYSRPDTAVLKVGGAEVLVSIYSQQGKIAPQVSQSLSRMLQAQKEYLGGKLPVNKYAFLVHLSSTPSHSHSWGAQEHSYSSLYNLPEMPAERLGNILFDIASHEFFHVVTPLSIHSVQIEDFDYTSPKMSEHLWLYEGCTEYAAGLYQVKYGLKTKDEFLKWLQDKLKGASSYNDTLPFTRMSSHVLLTDKPSYANQYGNVYQKGALIGMCLDLQLRSLSGGSYGLQQLMRDLAATYGKNKPFKDEELFDKITELAGGKPAVREFFRRYVEGTEPLPLIDLLGKAGISFEDFTLGNISLAYNPETNKLFVKDTAGMNHFGNVMGYRIGDELVSFNGKPIEPTSFAQLLTDTKANTQVGQVWQLVVLRKDAAGKAVEVTLNAPAEKISSKNLLSFMANPSAAQQALQDAWLKP